MHLWHGVRCSYPSYAGGASVCGCWCCRVQSTVQLDRVRLQRPSPKWLLVQLHPCPLSDSGFWLPLLLCTAVSSRYADARLRCTGFLRRLISCSSYVVCCGFSGSTAQKAQHCFPAHTTFFTRLLSFYGLTLTKKARTLACILRAAVCSLRVTWPGC